MIRYTQSIWFCDYIVFHKIPHIFWNTWVTGCSFYIEIYPQCPDI
nr:MAG TPA: hypothetical protein [Caudoviricetes sp.]